ncbi:MAG: helix-turn-helix domain containing protein [Methylomonas sp.]|jgi:hypothetical protein|uniref:helix-turn-helix domain-containing protein n=1 Tax=Methylomonas sp. TaxID=418 RepID=UPI0025FF8FA0|nr:helix-turn-helix domain-containing protein [Methylomonas sp.]MCK9606218.1 helix-turn-helix domain containing protein [Methylomonas sp.]
MNFFEEATLRLKQQLKVTEDKEAAELLGLNASAWAKRKKRESFPTKEVFALATQRPELGLDPDWIVTGTSLKTEIEGNEELSLLQCYRMMNSHNQYQLRQIALLWSGVMELKATPPTNQGDDDG